MHLSAMGQCVVHLHPQEEADSGCFDSSWVGPGSSHESETVRETCCKVERCVFELEKTL